MGQPLDAGRGLRAPFRRRRRKGRIPRALPSVAFHPKRPMRPSLRRLTRPLTCAELEDRRFAAASIASSGMASIWPAPNRGGGFRCELRTRIGPCRPGERLAPGVVGGVGAIAVQHHAARLLEACMERGRESRIGLWFAARRGLGIVTHAVLEPSGSEIHAERIGEACVVG